MPESGDAPGATDGRRQRGHRKRAHILDTAVELLAAHGPTGLTHRAVAAASGVPLGSTTYYFASREDLTTAAITHAVEQEITALRDLAASSGLPGDLAGSVAALAAFLLDQITHRRTLLLAQYEGAVEAARRADRTGSHARLMTAYEELAADLLTRLGGTGDPERARMLVVCLDGVVLRHLAAPSVDGDALERSVAFVVEAALRP